MYKLSDYLSRGFKLINNNLFPKHKKLSTIMLYATDRCNSQCKHCYIWKKTPKQHLPFEKIKEIINSSVVSKNTVIGLEGGEFILHPEAEQILDYLMKNHPKYDLLSNCVLPDKLIEYAKKYKPYRVYVSLDGTPETYLKMRGVDAHDKVIQVIRELKGIVPVSVMFTLTPYNDFEDLKHVAKICKEHNCDMRVGIFNTMEYFETKSDTPESNSLDFEPEDIPEVVKEFDENYDFMVLYTQFKRGNLKLSCNSIRDSIVIYPSGDIPICQNKEIILGNLHNESLKEIINKSSTVKIHKEHKNNCNQCWVNFHRKYDIILYRNFEKVMPKLLVKKILGNYYWDYPKNVK
jgi:MoaA/NifB/PqqE/SkfB family radical SAM enzyme